MSQVPRLQSHAPASRDALVLVVTRVTRMFAYGCISVILALYLADIGFTEAQIGVLFSLTLGGDALLSLWLTTSADRIGRRRVLVIGAVLMAMAGCAFAWTGNHGLLIAAAIVGVISPSGNEIGPFLAVEQAALAEIVPPTRRTDIFARYQVAASFAGALGALVAGAAVTLLAHRGVTTVAADRLLFVAYAVAGLALAALFLRLSPAVEVPPDVAPPTFARRFGLHRSRGVVARLSALFAIDSFGGGFVLQSLIAYWFHVKFGANEGAIGSLLFACNLVAGVTSLLAARLAARIGLIQTMFVTHLPSNVLLCLVPFMPTYPLAMTVLILRFSISQMDVPTRQSYIVAVVDPDERSAASGITTIARSIGAALSPAFSGALMATSLAAPFVVSGGLKILYDVLLYRGFKAHPTPEERRQN